MEPKTEIIHVTILRETRAAWLMRDCDNPEREAYFPQSEISFKRRNIKTGDAMAEIPLWLLEQKGWNQ
jgi:hypothetical protein